MKKSRDLRVGVIWLLVGIFYLAGTFGIHVFEGAGATWISSRTIPMLWGICMILLSLRLIWRGIKELREEKEIAGEMKTEIPEGRKEMRRAVAATLVLLVAYAGLMKKVGFPIMTAVYLFLQITVLTPKEKRRPLTALLISVVFSIAVYALFVYALNVPLPAGLLG